MRIIKFRAWDKFNNKMLNNFIIQSEGSFFDQYKECTLACGCQEYGIERTRRIDPKYIMQYTGLKDKNGEEIYEGDIVDPHGGNLKAVTWIEHGFKLVNYQGTAGFVDQFYHCSIVGNIHENPELLE